MARYRLFEEDLGSEVVFWFVAHIHDHSQLFAVLNDDPGILSVIPIVLFGYVAPRVTGSLRLSFPGFRFLLEELDEKVAKLHLHGIRQFLVTSCLRSTSSLPQRASSTSSLWTT